MWEFATAAMREQIELRRRRADGDPFPLHAFERKALAARPRTNETVDEVLRALGELDTVRPLGMAGVGRIPITAIWDYWDRKGLDGEAHELMTRLTRIADDTELAERAKKAKAKS